MPDRLTTSVLTTIEMINRYSQNFLLLFTIFFGSLSGTTIVLRSSLNWNRPFAALYRMYEYHNEHPFSYIAIAAVGFGLVGSSWIEHYGNTIGYWRWWTMTVSMLLTIVIASPFGGMLWHVHDMQHGFVPENYLSKVLGGITDGLQCGWLVALLSIPINLIGFAVGYISLHWRSKLAQRYR